jgi:hypothetical protein
MRPRTKAARALVVLIAAAGSLGACGLADSDEQSSVDVQPVSDTTVEAGSLTVVVPAGAATGGELALQEGGAPTLVPEGVQPLGRTTVVALLDGSLDGTMSLSFEPPAELTSDQVPVVMAKEGQADWQWLPTSWEGGDAPVTAELSNPGQVFLARFDGTHWLDESVEEFVSKANNPSKAHDPDCGDTAAAAARGLEVTSEDGDTVKWCAGVDTIDSNPATSDYDVNPTVEGVQAPVLRVTNNSRMFEEVGYPEAWPAVDGSGHAMAGQELRTKLGLAGTIRDGLASRVLAPGETLNLLLPAGGTAVTGTVTADLSAAAWTLSALDFGTSTYTRLVAGVDEELGEQVRANREALFARLAPTSVSGDGEPQAPLPTGGVVEPEGSEDAETTVEEPVPAVSDEDLDRLRECLAPVSEVILMNQDAAKQLVDEAMSCAVSFLRPVLAEQYGTGPAQMADGVASSVLSGLPSALRDDDAPWAEIPDALTDPGAGHQVWVGPPPAQ